MNKEEFIEKIKDMKINVADEEFFLEYNKTIYDILDSQEKLIKYLEDKMEDCDYQIDIIGNYQKICEKRAYKDILERVKSGKYE